MTDTFSYHRHLDTIVQADTDYVRRKDRQYDASWKRRGGQGAFFTIVRPWDRLESMARVAGDRPAQPAGMTSVGPYDIFGIIEHEGLKGPDGSMIACVRDLRRYLLLLEAEMTERLAGSWTPSSTFERGTVIGNVRTGLGGGRVAACDIEIIDPGSPEDGGHHARQQPELWPWYLENTHSLDIPTEMRDIWTTGMTLEPRITSEQYEKLFEGGGVYRAVAALYRPVYAVFLPEPNVTTYRDEPESSDHAPAAYWLDLRKCPESERDRYRHLPQEQNLKAAEDLMEYRELYSWVRDRYVLRRRVWGME